jgi:23S rRNA pseudouridine1911/1915/1917 synthase
MPHELTIAVPPGKKRERIDLFLAKCVQNATRSKVQQAIRGGHVLVGGRTVRPSHMVSPGEVITVTLPSPPPGGDVLPEHIPLAILFEDDHLLVVDKPAGMVTHPAYGHYTGTLVNALLYHCATLSSLNGPVRAGIVHRLDKDTSGLLVVAKDERAHAHLARQFERRTVEREYRAIVWGTFKERSGTVEAELGRSKSDRKKIAVVTGGKAAVTEYTVLEQFQYLALLALHLRTGRTHQIRVHLAHIHHPVFGDPTYSGRGIMAGSASARQKADVQAMLDVLPRQALHARTLGFTHPVTGQKLHFESALPHDMADVLSYLKEKSHFSHHTQEDP